ncbi:MAG: hypothetical protein PHG82_05525 [Candidatus Gracilibacteria bacterium]|nr:hypothetical protein [Candidatus Gracilibacteria bacterium]
MKKYIIFLSSVFLLSSCFFSSTATPVDSSSLKQYVGSGFTMSTPNSWTLIDKNSSTLPKPNGSSIALAVTSPDMKYGFANNMLILKTKVAKDISSKNFSTLNNVGSSRDYKNYLKLAEADITFNDSVISSLYTFEAKYNETTPNLKFLQTAVVCPSLDAYFITLALNVDIKDTSKYEDMLKTFKCN